MKTSGITVGELQQADLAGLADYWYGSPAAHLTGMGVDLQKLPSRADFIAQIGGQLALPVAERRSYAVVWKLNGQSVGHCNLNPFSFGGTSQLHLHLWRTDLRQQGLGAVFLKKSLTHFFDLLQLQQIICEPFAQNPAPNALLAKMGFTYVKTYRTTPGSINFEQEVKQWVLNKTAFASFSTHP